MKETDIIANAEALPIDMKAKLIERLLLSLNPSQKEIDELWAQEAERRIKEVEQGNIETIPGEEVFKKIHNKFGK